jgi:hypothetical protein
MFDELMARIAGRFGRVEPRRRARSFVLGLLAELPRKNCWNIAEHAGDASPDGMQHLLGRARWDAGAVRDDLRDYVVERLGRRRRGIWRRSWAARGLEKRQIGYVLAVAKSHRVNAGAGACRADALATRLPRPAWQRYSAGAGAKGHRLYDWALIGTGPGRPGHRWLLIRRNYRTAELAFYLCYAPPRPPRRARQGRGAALDRGRGLPGRQGTSRPQ